MKLFDLKIDFAFKQLFGREGNEVILIDFLNAALGMKGEGRIVEIQLLDTHINKEYEEDKLSIMDVHAKTKEGVLINIEIQLHNRHDMAKRSLYYWSKMFSGQLNEGMAYGELAKTVTINILNFRYFQETERYHSTFQLFEREEKFQLTDVLEVHFMELFKFLRKWKNGEVSAREDALAKWLLFLEVADYPEIVKELEEIAVNDPVLKKAFDELERISQDPETMVAYEARRKMLLDEKAAIKEAERRGRIEGKIEVALTMLANGMDMESVAKLTGLSLNEVKELIQ